MRNAGLANGKPAVLVIIYRQPNANIIETVDRVTALLPAARGLDPAGHRHRASRWTGSTTIRASLHDVERTLMIAICLVILVVFLFLRELARDADPERRRAGVADRHVRRHVSAAASASTICR